MLTLEVVFWVLVGVVIYTYVGYGVILCIILKVKRIICHPKTEPQLPENEQDYPGVTLMICAYNEETVVGEKMKNTLLLRYPKDKLHIMWVTDGSSDRTNELLAAYPEVQVVFSPERKGKAAAMQHGLQENTNEFVVFTDANTMLNSEAISEVMRLFMQQDVGCVSGEKRVSARRKGEVAAEGEGAYWKYESRLKQWDSELYSAMGAAGELFAVRMSVYQQAPSNALLDDFMISMLILKKGYRIAYTSKAYAMEYGSANLTEESKRKRRIAAGGLQSSWWLRSMMNPLRYPKVAFQFVSHRVLRWTLAPLSLVMLVPVNAVLVAAGAGWTYNAAAIVQLLFYSAALAGGILATRGHRHRLLYVPYYFLFMNLNVFHAVGYLHSHSHSGTWEKAERG